MSKKRESTAMSTENISIEASNESNTENKNLELQKANQKRLVIVTGDKGGVGKSTFSRGLLQVYVNKKIHLLAYDADKRNPQLERHYGKDVVRCLDIFNRGEADVLLVNLDEQQPPIALLDLPAQSSSFFETFERELNIFDSLKECGYQITIVSVISRVKDSVSILKLLYEYCGDRVDYLVVKNLFYGAEDKFERYDESKLRKQMKDKVTCQEIVMPDLFYKTYDFLDEHSLPFTGVYEHAKANLAIRLRVKSWLAEFEKNALKAAAMLVLE